MHSSIINTEYSKTEKDLFIDKRECNIMYSDRFKKRGKARLI